VSFLSKLTKTVIPAAFGFARGGPVGAFAGTVGALESQRAERKFSRIQKQQAQESNMMDFGTNRSTFRDPYAGTGVLVPNYGTQNAGGGFFSNVGSFFRDAGGLVRDVFNSGIPQLFGVGRPQGVTQQPAITTVTNQGAQESQGSGSVEAGLGGLLPAITQGIRNVVTNPIGQIGIGTAVGGALSLIDGAGRQVRITRKTKRLAQQAYQLSMGDLSAATNLFANLSGISVNEMQFVQILTKRFRNDGAVITKAALRKTKSTIRKMKSMCDMYDDLRPAARRRSPMKRATRSTTLIKN
tara:strand:- start:97 stop:987 length:891 start_codon:yes stop_codon:yes gene_type:complete